MNTWMEEYCKELNVNFQDLLHKMQDGLDGVSISHFTDGELQILHDSLLVAGE